MLRHYLKITLRNIRRHKGYTFINVAGLAISLACCMLISLWLLNEMSFDDHYPDMERIQAILSSGHFSSSNALASYLKENVPEIQYSSRMTHGNEALVKSGSQNSYQRIVAADPDIIDILSFEFISGDPSTALTNPNSAVVTREIASKFYQDQDALGKILTLDNQNVYTVTGVVEDIPANSTVRFDLLVPMDYQRQPFVAAGFDYDSWKFWSTRTIVKGHPGVTPLAMTEKISGLVQKYYDDREVTLSAINISDVHLRFSESRKTIPVFSAIALAILAMASINFVNLSTARYRTRAKETAMRKIIGARRGALVAQFLGESAFLTFTGVFIALGLVEMVLPLFNSLFGLHLSLALFYNVPIALTGVAISAVIALATGIYPALVLSRFHPVQALRNSLDSSNRRFNLRRILVVLQFSLTAVLAIGIAIIYSQINHMKNWDVGYDQEHVININLRGESGKRFDALKNELLQNQAILAVTGGAVSLPYWDFSTTSTWDGLNPDEERDINFNFIKYDFTKTFGIELIEGRDFDESYGTDEQLGCVINETLARSMNQDPIIGSRINVWDQDRKVIGVMKDFNFQPLEDPLGPLALVMIPPGEPVFAQISALSIRINPGDIQGTLNYIEDTWNKVVPDHPFEYSFLDQEFDANYRSLEQVNNLALCFGLLAVFIAALGLFGLASFTAEQRTNEIGIRKVLGASVPSIVRMMSREYVILVGISNLVAWPLAWYIMSDWLKGFAYHVNVGIGIFRRGWMFHTGCCSGLGWLSSASGGID